MNAKLLICAALLIGATSANAQDKKDIQPMDKAWVVMNTEMLNVELGLNDVQKEKVKDIDMRYAKKHEALENTTPKLTESQMADKVEVLMKERDKELKAVLNADQYAKWEKKRHMGTSELRDDQKEQMKK